MASHRSNKVSNTLLHYELHTAPFALSFLDNLFDLAQLVFGNIDRADDEWRLARMPQCTAFTASAADTLVGFKAGYAVTSKRYYSWLGGTHPNLRGRGVAHTLMSQQHHWLQANGYQVVETEARQNNLAMCQLNSKAGFVAVGSKQKSDGRVNLYRKPLAPRPMRA